MRDASIAVLREIGVETGGSNVQFAVNPENGRMVVIEMNPRVSRSSALGLEGDGLSDRQGRGKARRRLHARRAGERHHARRDAGRLRADDRLRRRQDSPLRLREISERRAGADDFDEVGRRGDGDRPDLRRIAAEGAARPGDGALRPRRGGDSGARRRRRQERGARRARHAPPRPAAHDCAGAPARLRRRPDPRILPRRPVVPARDQDARRLGGACPRARSAGERAALSPAEVARLLRRSGSRRLRERARRRSARFARASASRRSSSGSTPAPPSSPRRPPTCIRPTRPPSAARWRTRRARRTKTKVIILGGGPNRIGQGHRVRLLLLPCRLRARRGGVRDRSW